VNVTEFAELDALTTDELRERAFVKAKEERDLGFFWGLFRHLPNADEPQESDLADVGGAIEDAVQLWREFTKHEYGSNEPLIRANFIDYLSKSES
jgi:hypothetical protein